MAILVKDAIDVIPVCNTMAELSFVFTGSTGICVLRSNSPLLVPYIELGYPATYCQSVGHRLRWGTGWF